MEASCCRPFLTWQVSRGNRLIFGVRPFRFLHTNSKHYRQNRMRLSIPILVIIGLLVLVAFQCVLTVRMTAIHNAQLKAQTENHNAQLLAQTERHNAQLLAQAAEFQQK